MTNDILEQITEDYLRELGYFTQHNVPYRPNNSGTHSDIDIVALHPSKKGVSRVIVVSCKSWQSGVDIKEVLNALATNPDKIIHGGTMKKRFREIADPIWSKALREEIFKRTKSSSFTFLLSATSFKGDRKTFIEFPLFKNNLKECNIELIDFAKMITVIKQELTTTPSHSELSRLLQLMKASDIGKGG